MQKPLVATHVVLWYLAFFPTAVPTCCQYVRTCNLAAAQAAVAEASDGASVL